MRSLFFFILLFSACLGSSQAQERVNDARAWLRLGVSAPINDQIKWVGKMQLGMADNAQKFDFFYVRNELQWKLTAHLSAIANYSIYRQQTRRENFRTGHRLAAGFKYDFSVQRWDFQWRSLFLSRWNALLTDEEGMLARYRNRNRLGVFYTLNQRAKLGVQNEMYLELNRQDKPFLGANRLTFALRYKLSKKAVLEPNFIIINRDLPWSRDFVYRMSCYYQF